jgi:phage-related protein
VVGTAYVVIKAITKGLDKQIGDSVDDGVKKAAPSLEKSGEKVGDSIGDGAAKGIGKNDGITKAFEKIPDRIGARLKTKMSGLGDRAGGWFHDGYERSTAARAAGWARRFTGRISAGLTRQVSGLGDRIARAFWNRANKPPSGGSKLGASIADGVKKIPLPKLLALAGFALPLIGGALKIVGSYVAATISLVSALGPAFAGAALVGASSFLALGTGIGAVMLALKTKGPMLDRFKEVTSAIGKEWSKVGQAIQREVLPVFGQSLTRITDAVLPTMQARLVQTGRIVGRISGQFAAMTENPLFQARLANVMKGNNNALRSFGTAFVAIADTAVILLSAARPLTEQFGKWVEKLAVGANLAAKNGEANGKLAAFMERAGKSASQLGRIFHNVFYAIWDVLKAASPAGQTLLDRIEALTLKWATWTSSVGGKNKMSKWFADALPVVHEFNGLIGDVFRLLGEGMTGGGNKGTIEFIKTIRTQILPTLVQIAKAFSNAGPGLSALFASIGDFFEQMGKSGALGAFTTALQTVFTVLAKILAAPVIGQIAGWTLSIFAFLKAVSFIPGFGGVLKLVGGLLQWIATTVIRSIVIPAVAALSAALGISVGWLIVIAAAIAALIAGLIWAYNNVDWFRAAIDKAWEVIVAGALWMWEKMQSVWAWFQDTALPIIQSVFGWIRDNVFPILVTVAKFVGGVLVGAFKIWWAVLTAVFGWITGTLIPILRNVWNVLFEVGKFIVNVLVAAFKALWAITVTVFGWIRDYVVPIVTAMWNVLFEVGKFIGTVLVGAFQAMWGVVSWVFQAIYAIVGKVVTMIGIWFQIMFKVASTVWNAVWTVVSTVFGWIWARISTVAGWIGGVFRSIWTWASTWFGRIGTFISGVWSTITSAIGTALDPIRTAFQVVYNQVKGIWEGLGKVLGAVWTTVSNGVKGAFNSIKDWINEWIIDKANGAIDILNNVPGPDIPTIPRLAAGGTVFPRPGGVLATIAEAGRPERVEPLDQNGLSNRDRALIAALTGGGVGEVRVFIGDRELTDIVKVEVDRGSSAAARNAVYARVGVGQL